MPQHSRMSRDMKNAMREQDANRNYSIAGSTPHPLVGGMLTHLAMIRLMVKRLA